MSVYDCFTFYNEFELLELRLRALWDVVDCFVIVEANRKHNGEPKNFLLRELYESSPKIRCVSVDLSNVPYGGAGDWSIEITQRNAIAYGLEDAQPDDLILIGDADEIIAPDVFRRLRENQIELFAPTVVPVTIADKSVTCPAWLTVSATEFLEYGAIVMDQKFHYYYFDWVSKATWQGTILTKRKNLTTPQALRNLHDVLPRVDNGGYHFSYMGGADRVIDKMTSIVDGNQYVVHSGGKFIDRRHVEESLSRGTDLYGRTHLPELVPFDAHKIALPHAEEFLRKYPNFLREPKKYFDT
ncbi:MAG: hypothetical protein IKD80_08395 [Selenomonadaceae bacterium]|nr:hypothetical protein [Selenomonadaceae bacterium]